MYLTNNEGAEMKKNNNNNERSVYLRPQIVVEEIRLKDSIAMSGSIGNEEIFELW